MRILVGIIGFALSFFILWDAFETVILPRRVTRSFRLARLFYRSVWKMVSALARGIRSPRLRETYLSFFGPLTLLALFALWAWALILAFGLLQWAGGSAVGGSNIGSPGFRADFYVSGTTFFTLGIGDVVPHTSWARAITIVEAGTGFGFLAIVISYMPTLYGSFSQREINISMLDARAGSPPTAAELLRRHGRQRIQNGLGQYLHDWETWSAQLMESHLTYPVLCFFRSQHDNQSWVAAFTAILDVSALLIAYGDGETKWQAQLTFATARHAVADLSEILRVRALPPKPDRLPPEDLPVVRSLLLQCGVPGCTDAGDFKLIELRAMYEGHLNGLARLLQMPMPTWGVHSAKHAKPTAWDRISSRQPETEPVHAEDHKHF